MSWPENLTKLTIEELGVLHRRNEVWAKQLRLQVKLLMDTKTAGQISEDQYANQITITNKDIAECVRRRQLLGKL